MEPLLYSIEDTCRLLSLGQTKVFELLSTGQLKSVKIGRKRLIQAASIREIAEHGLPPKPKKD